jgi:hypothetical protein
MCFAESALHAPRHRWPRKFARRAFPGQVAIGNRNNCRRTARGTMNSRLSVFALNTQIRSIRQRVHAPAR